MKARPDPSDRSVSFVKLRNLGVIVPPKSPGLGILRPEWVGRLCTRLSDSVMEVLQTGRIVNAGTEKQPVWVTEPL